MGKNVTRHPPWHQIAPDQATPLGSGTPWDQTPQDQAPPSWDQAPHAPLGPDPLGPGTLMDRHEPVNILPCPRLRLWVVIICTFIIYQQTHFPRILRLLGITLGTIETI